MGRILPDVDIVKDVLEAVLKEQPNSVFVNSLYHQYCERGGLSKKQLEGLHSKASKFQNINTAKLATLEAIIKKKPNRHKSEAPVISDNLFIQDKALGETINSILAKYPQHKRVLFLKAMYDANKKLSPTDITEIKKFEKILLK